jgi:prepilin peptidase CpaA
MTMQAAVTGDDMVDVNLQTADPRVIGDEVETPQDHFAVAGQAKHSLPISITIATLIAAVLAYAHVAVGPKHVLPVYLFAAGFLVLAVQQDMFRRKIPNWLVGPGILVALAYNTYQFGLTGLFASLIGCALPFVMLIALYAGRSMGAGDIKALMSLGALWGVAVILQVIMWSLVIGGVMALAILLYHGELLSMLHRWKRMLSLVLFAGQFRYEPPSAGEAAAGALPFGIAIALGVAAAQLAQGGLI